MTSTPHTRPNLEARNKFLSKFADSRKSTVTNRFLDGPRAGLTDPQAVVDDVIRTTQEHIRRTTFEATAIREQLLLQTIKAFLQEALDFAQWAIDYVYQPAEQREETRRAQQAEHVNRWLSNQPASERQIAYLHSLGYRGEVVSKLHASQLIEQWKQNGGRR